MNRLQRNLKTMDVPLKVALKQHADSSFKNYNLLKVLNLSNSEYNAINNLSSPLLFFISRVRKTL